MANADGKATIIMHKEKRSCDDESIRRNEANPDFVALQTWCLQLELADPLDGLDQPRRLDGQGGADVAVGGPAEANARRRHDVRLFEDAAAQLGRRIAGGAGDPDVERGLWSAGRPSRSSSEPPGTRRGVPCTRPRIGGVRFS